MKKLIIIINDENRIDEISDAIIDAYKVMEFEKGEVNIENILKLDPALIILNCYKVEDMNWEYLNRLSKYINKKYVPIIILSDNKDDEDEMKAFDKGVADYMVYPINKKIFIKRIDSQIELSTYRNNLEGLVKKKTKDIIRLQYVMTKSMAELVEFRDATTGGHVKRTEEYVKILVNRMAKKDAFKDILNRKYISDLIRSAPLHDLGKIGIADSTLLKNGSLTEEEFEYMKQHTTLGEKAINYMLEKVGKNSFLSMARDVAVSHHEAWDGSGYPKGLKKTEIPLSGRIMAVADIYDALTTVRPYKKAFTHEESVEIIKSESGKKLDPTIVDIFLEIEHEYKKVMNKNDRYDF